jgi:hypothetical protein
MQLDHELVNPLSAEAQLFRDLMPPHWTIQQLQQAPNTGTRETTVASCSIRNCLETAGLSATGRMPPLRTALLGQPEPRQHAKRSCGIVQVKLRVYRDFRF